MTSTITYTLGKFVWHELYTPDVEASRRFYSDVFGWRWQDAPMGDFTYRLAYLGEKQVGGMMALADMGESASRIPPHWSTYVCVDDVDGAAERVQAHGGQVMMAPQDIPNVGRFATVMDPQGAVTNLYRSKSGDGADGEPGPGDWCWESLMTTDPQAAIAFYQAVVGWGTTPMASSPDTLLFTREQGARQVANVSPASPGLPPHWLSYIAVADREATNAKITAAGGTLIAPQIDLPGVGFIALVQDPQGVMFCTFQAG